VTTDLSDEPVPAPAASRAEIAIPLLDLARDMVEPALRAAVARLHADLALITSYQAGWTTETGEPLNRAAGKRLRACLALLSATTAGAPPDVAVPGAVAAELVHAFSLLHDDVMDGDHTRRGRPAAWTVYGTPAAVLSGDAVLTLAVQLMADTGHRQATRLLASAVAALCHGQAEDSRFERCHDVSVNDYLLMVEGKTAALMVFSCVIGAILADASPRMVDQLRRLGYHLGISFQVADDILGIWGDPAVTGKPVFSDIARRKKTLPILAALASPAPAGAQLGDLLAAEHDLHDDELLHCARLIEQGGGRRRAEQEIAWQQDQAQVILHQLALEPTAHAAWQAMIAAAAHRQS
jgi:geranylgeranyl diphosphate synthase type I